MARAPNENAELDYMNGMKYKEIAEKYNVSLNTVKSWKTRYKWSKDGVSKTKKSVHTKKEKVCTQNKKNASKKEVIADEVKEIMENDELTDKQRLFCDYYVKYRNKTKAYMKAYKCSWQNANAHAYELWENVGVKKEIDKQLKELRENIKIDIQDLIQLNIDIAFADMKDYAEWGKKEIEDGKDEKGKPVKMEINYVDFIDSNEVDGTIISEIKKGKDGVSVKLQDKMKAIEFLKKHIEFLDENTKRQLGIEEQKTRIEVLKSKVPNTSTIDMQGQITALADLINNPAKERSLDD
ncbi:terminase small subunit [Clostridium saccharoperbutylacetonicum]|uniref:terminase small subunit n=1 Tax=Clostridium saccharoperbutylacetonicum TaxID=36745 RepID=UPI0039E9E572